jgi:hypothetical protein
MDGNPLTGDMNPRTVARMMRSTDRLAGVLQQDVPGMNASAAEIFCDIVNVIRADVKRLADYHGVDVEIKMMSEDRAAELIAGLTDGDGVELVVLFNEIARKRNKILQEVLTDEEYQRFMEQKTSAMHTDDPDTWEA